MVLKIMIISNVIVGGFIVKFCTNICILIAFLLYDTLMMITEVIEICG